MGKGSKAEVLDGRAQLRRAADVWCAIMLAIACLATSALIGRTPPVSSGEEIVKPPPQPPQSIAPPVPPPGPVAAAVTGEPVPVRVPLGLRIEGRSVGKAQLSVAWPSEAESDVPGRTISWSAVNRQSGARASGAVSARRRPSAGEQRFDIELPEDGPGPAWELDVTLGKSVVRSVIPAIPVTPPPPPDPSDPAWELDRVLQWIDRESGLGGMSR